VTASPFLWYLSCEEVLKGVRTLTTELRHRRSDAFSVANTSTLFPDFDKTGARGLTQSVTLSDLRCLNSVVGDLTPFDNGDRAEVASINKDDKAEELACFSDPFSD
jgi:hypothetical protein